MPIPADEVADIQREIWQRAFGGRNQPSGKPVTPAPEALLPWRSPATGREFSVADLAKVSAWKRDVDYLRGVMLQVGWIDAERFGYPTSSAAFFLLQHSWDVPLMMAALPWIERDVEAGRTEGEDYALLFDRLQLAIGEKQRYGTQVGIDSSNAAFVFPLEEPGQVEDRRKTLGLMPLAEYVGLVARFNNAYAPEKTLVLTDCAQ